MLKKQNQNYLIKKLCPSPRVLLNGSYFSIFPSLEWQILFCPSPTTENQLCERQSTYYFLGFFLFCRDLSFTWRYWAWSWFVFKRLNFRRYHLNSPFADQEYKANKKSAFHLLKRKQNRWQSHLSGIFLWYQVKFS